MLYLLISTSQRGRYSRFTKRKQAREVTKPEEGGKLNRGWARIETPVWLGSRHSVTLPFRRTCSAFKEVTQRNWNKMTVQRIQFQILTPSFCLCPSQVTKLEFIFSLVIWGQWSVLSFKKILWSTFFKRIFWCGPFFETFIEFVTTLLFFFLIIGLLSMKHVRS